jgi:hypothetical protein
VFSILSKTPLNLSTPIQSGPTCLSAQSTIHYCHPKISHWPTNPGNYILLKLSNFIPPNTHWTWLKPLFCQHTLHFQAEGSTSTGAYHNICSPDSYWINLSPVQDNYQIILLGSRQVLCCVNVWDGFYHHKHERTDKTGAIT